MTLYNIGTVPSILCDNTAMSFLHITDGGTNPMLTRSPKCLTTVTDRIIPPNYQDAAICSFIAATNIEFIGGYAMWSCTTDGVTSTNPCNVSATWSRVVCSGSSIVTLNVHSIGISGKVVH